MSTCTAIFRAVDKAGNKGSWTAIQHIHMDTEIPVINHYNYGTISDICANDLSDISSMYLGYTTGNYNAYWEIDNAKAWNLWGYRNRQTNEGNIDLFKSGSQWCYRFEGISSGTIGVIAYDFAGNSHTTVFKR